MQTVMSIKSALAIRLLVFWSTKNIASNNHNSQASIYYDFWWGRFQ